MCDKLFTVIIPEHNRPERLRRLLDYYLSFDCEIIVTDSSDIRFKYIDEYLNDIYYVYYPKMHLAEKLFRILDHITTSYVVMCADDDYIVPSAILQAIHYMQEDDDYRSVQGLYVRYYPLENISLDLFCPYMLGNSINENTGEERVLHLMSNYYQFYYAVFEKKLFIEAYSSVIVGSTCKIRNLCLLELYISLYSVIRSKHAVLPVLYGMREYIRDSAGTYTLGLKEIMDTNQCTDELNYMLNNLADIIEGNKEEKKKVLENAFDLYLHSFVCNSQKGIIERILLKLDLILFNRFCYKLYAKKVLYKMVNDKNDAKNSITQVKNSIKKYFSEVYGLK